MSYPKTYRTVRRSAKPYLLTVEITNETLPESLDPDDVVIRIHAASVNYRDVAMLHEGGYPLSCNDREIQGKYCAAEIIVVGDAVKIFTLGDRVTVTPNLSFLTGEENDVESCALGSETAGAMREYAVYEEKYLVKLPLHLSWEEAATITGVDITAWVSLDGLKDIPKNATALLQGTGGVSVMFLLLCLESGIRPITTCRPCVPI
ncbi:GroES-like protein [Bimuria novae-zelandiae CBS 107.79]|uniref:GroES-like protein n=1 Tax=Bimuria novae-zelandiae CBS 107.79 TaxID=1447943 RepID=A0A6A5UXA0_9PLEO|nr:GroES-like protein [Bimuria novae-zelandiae CBS 107.79]